MTAPEIRHARWCTEPPLRSSAVMLSRHQTRWRCPECGAEVYVIAQPVKENQQ